MFTHRNSAILQSEKVAYFDYSKNLKLYQRRLRLRSFFSVKVQKKLKQYNKNANITLINATLLTLPETMEMFCLLKLWELPPGITSQIF